MPYRKPYADYFELDCDLETAVNHVRAYVRQGTRVQVGYQKGREALDAASPRDIQNKTWWKVRLPDQNSPNITPSNWVNGSSFVDWFDHRR